MKKKREPTMKEHADAVKKISYRSPKIVGRINYRIKIGCDINEYGAVIPNGGSSSIEDVKGENLNVLDFPKDSDIMIIWIGICKQYPKANKRI